MDEMQRLGLEQLREASSIMEKMMTGEISDEDAVQQILALTAKNTLDTLDLTRKMNDDVAAAYAAGDFANMQPLLEQWLALTVATGRSILMQMQAAEEFGIDGSKGLDGLF